MPSSPTDRRRETEETELLRLVGEVLESARKREEKRQEILPILILETLRDWRRAATRKIRERPILSTSVLVGFMSVAYLCGILTTSMTDRNINQSPKVARSFKEVPERIARRGGARFGSSSGSSGGGGRPGLVAQTTSGVRADVAKTLLLKIVEGEFDSRDDIATGRFLRDFERQWLLLRDVDRTKLRPTRRGKNWIQFTGPYRRGSDAESWRHRTHLGETGPAKSAEEAIIRLVKRPGWKIEYIRVY